MNSFYTIIRSKLWMIVFIVPMASCGSDSSSDWDIESEVVISTDNAIEVTQKSLSSAEFALTSVSAFVELIESLTVTPGNQILGCPGGGTESIKVDNFHASVGITSGTRITIIDDNCTDIENTSATNGELEVKVLNTNGNLFDGRITFKGYSIEYNQMDVESIVFDGTTQFNKVEYLDRYMIYDDNISPSTNILNIITTSNSSSNTVTLKDHRISRELVSHDGDQYEIEIKAIFTSEEIGGQVKISTPDKLYGTINSTPISGSIQILGDSGSNIQLTGIDSTYIEIQVEDEAGSLISMDSTYQWTDVLKGLLWTF